MSRRDVMQEEEGNVLVKKLDGRPLLHWDFSVGHDLRKGLFFLFKGSYMVSAAHS